MNPAYRCPTCGSDDTASLAIMHARGISRSVAEQAIVSDADAMVVNVARQTGLAFDRQ